MSANSSPIGFIGLGSMGLPMARLLLKAGFQVRAYNRSRAKAETLAAEQAADAEGANRATVADSPADAVQAGGVVVSMLSDDAALREVVCGDRGLLKTLDAGGLHISMSTVAPETTRELAALHAQHGSELLAAPVFGRPEAAAAKKLWICRSGSVAAAMRAQAVLEALSQGIYDFGNEVGAANVVKLSGNFMILAAIEAMAEAFAFGEKNGLDRQALAGFFGQTIFSCPIYQNYGRILAERAYDPPGFALPLGMKDVRLVRGVAEDSRVPMPLADLLHARLLTAMAKQREHLDWTAIELSSAEDAGLR